LERLRELGWIEGKTVSIEFRFADGRHDRFAEYAGEFIRLNVDVILTDGGATLVAKRMTSVIPVVFAVAADPLGGGYVNSLAHPGGNVTGSSLQAYDTAAKRLGLLREALPRLDRLAVLVNPNYPAAVLEATEVEAVARKLGIASFRAEVSRAEDFASVIGGVRGRAEAIYACADSFFNSNRNAINAAALAARLPTSQFFQEASRAGGLMSYGANFPALFRRAAETVDKILRGAKPGDLPVEQPTKFDLVINLKTAKELGIDLPPTLLASADEVIE
jgi:putative ABC transport system substrate-binding protein